MTEYERFQQIMADIKYKQQLEDINNGKIKITKDNILETFNNMFGI